MHKDPVEILCTTVVPFIQECLLMVLHDNAQPHVAKKRKQFLLKLENSLQTTSTSILCLFPDLTLTDSNSINYHIAI